MLIDWYEEELDQAIAAAETALAALRAVSADASDDDVQAHVQRSASRSESLAQAIARTESVLATLQPLAAAVAQDDGVQAHLRRLGPGAGLQHAIA